MSTQAIVIITSSEPRHRYFAAALGRQVTVAGILVEKKRSPAGSEAMTKVVAEHFARRDEKERVFAGGVPPFEEMGCRLLRTAWSGSNDRASIDWIVSLAPACVAVYGTGLIGAALLDVIGERSINCHLGLSPYYRGAATNIWPLVNGEPECVGATFHRLSPEVDAGPVFHQVRPDMAPDDDCHDIGLKTIRRAADAAGTIVQAFLREPLRGVSQTGGGRVFRKKDFSEKALLAMEANFAAGMIPRYLERKRERDAKFPIVESFR